jgi:5' nucleotidase, deoxy (Pyrimidine), cytosolic type C protein (NT5C)
MKIKPVVIFDMDDTLCLFINKVVTLIEQEFGMTISPTDIHEKWTKVFVNETHSRDFLTHVYNDNFYLSLEPRFPPSALKRLLTIWEPYFDFEVITHRGDPLGERAASVTREWLRSQGIVDYFANVKALCHREKKSSLAHPKAVLIFDDSKQVMRDFKANRPDVIRCVISNPWNWKYEVNGNATVRSVDDMDEALQIFCLQHQRLMQSI